MIAKWLFKTECNTVEFISPVFREPAKNSVQRKVLHPQADESQ
ncbi:hypothetical protein T03_12409 [Trichinella britovi]|uniref:Uncharacterized protein n=1 Tax=Trichinella britovi TaxID=45882 RepID=A0A0V0YX43_TRIBR|nr:hypothetical protein T03_12409 [Trichinella britovi]